MAIAAWLIWRTPITARRLDGLALFTVQLLLNLFWTPVFFHFHQLGAALGTILILWCLILLTALAFGTVNRLAATLFLPYLAWVAFASALNYEIFRLN
jgi:tryptophan-rich sensory protein